MRAIKIIKWGMFSFFVFALVMCFVTNKAHAERLLFLENGTLKVFVNVMEVEVPKEITDPQLAWAFVSGQTKKTIAGGKTITYMPKVGVQYGNEKEWSIVPITTTKH